MARGPLTIAILALVTVGSVTSAGAAGPRPRVRPPRALTLSNGYQSQLACASPKACVAVGANGVRETFNPTGRGRVTAGQTIAGSGGSYNQLGVTCPSAHKCVAVDAAGAVAVFDPTRGGGPSAQFTISGAEAQTGIACPTAHRCVVESYQGEAVFDPSRPGSPATSSFTANGNGAQPTISCPSVSFCAGTNGTGGLAYSYDPSTPGAAKVTTFTSTPQVGAISCPSRSFCIALASPAHNPATNTGFIAFNPAHPGNPKVKALTPSTLEFLTCASSTLCAAAGNNDAVIIFNPKHVHRHTVALPRSLDVSPSPDAAGIAFMNRTDLVVLSFSGRKAVIDAASPPKSVTLSALAKATKVARG